MPSKFTRVGTAYIRGTYYTDVTPDGVEKCIWAKWIPMFCHVEQYWFNVRAIGSIMGTAPDGSQEIHYRGGYTDINLSQEMVETDDFDGPEAMDRYMSPLTGSSFSGDDGDPPVNLGLSSFAGGQRSARWAKRELFSHTQTLGLPDKAVFSDANQITYVDRFRRQSPKDWNKEKFALDLPKLVALGSNCNAQADQTDWSTAMGGDLGGMNDLYRELLEHVGASGGADIALSGLGSGLDNATTAMHNYIASGRRATVVDIDQSMHVRVKGTLKVGVYDVDTGNRVLTAYR